MSGLRLAAKSRLSDVPAALGSYQNNFLMITKLINTASGMPVPTVTAGGFNEPDICWSRISR